MFVKKYESYTGRNPKTGETVKVKSKKLHFFRCAKDLKRRVIERIERKDHGEKK